MITRLKNFLLTSRLLSSLIELVQRFYEVKLLMEVRKGPIPRHVGVILDGNRRWARMIGLAPWEGHKRGYNKVRDLLSWCDELGIKVLTVYALSIENLRRPRRELDELFKLLKRGMDELKRNPIIRKRKIKINVIGRVELLPEDLKAKAMEVEEVTKDNDERIFNVALAYGGRQEIVDAIRKVVEKVVRGELEIEDINKEVIERNLYTAGLPPPDLVIRTSGEERLSGFLLWQASRSELYFCDVYWPNFRKIDFLRAIRDYQIRALRRISRRTDAAHYEDHEIPVKAQVSTESFTR